MSSPGADRRTGAAAAAALALAAAAPAAVGYPEGAPWGAADPGAAESCGDCHYDYEPVLDSPALSIEGLPATARAGERYRLVVRFADDEAAVSGFQLLARAESGEAGRFTAPEPGIETIGAAGRSTAPRLRDDGFEWPLCWRTPDRGAGLVTLYLAASAANDDQSPFGDRIHYRQFAVRLPGGGSKQ